MQNNMREVFLRPILICFDAPDIDDDGKLAEFYETLDNDLSFYSERCLELAAVEIRTTRKRNTFPTIAECVEACKKVHDQLSMAQYRNSPPKEKYPEWTPERIAAAERMICTTVARKMALHAAEHGWILRLHDFCREHDRLPMRHEADKIRRQHAEEEKKLEEAGGPGTWKPLREKMLKRREELAAMVRAAAEKAEADRADQGR